MNWHDLNKGKSFFFGEQCRNVLFDFFFLKPFKCSVNPFTTPQTTHTRATVLPLLSSFPWSSPVEDSDKSNLFHTRLGNAAASVSTRESSSVFSSCHLHHRPCDMDSQSWRSLIQLGCFFFFFLFGLSYFRLTREEKKGSRLEAVKPPRNSTQDREKKDEPAVRIMKNTRTVEGTELQACVKRICKDLLI